MFNIFKKKKNYLAPKYKVGDKVFWHDSCNNIIRKAIVIDYVLDTTPKYIVVCDNEYIYEWIEEYELNLR